jgi:hypothetical protein
MAVSDWKITTNPVSKGLRGQTAAFPKSNRRDVMNQVLERRHAGPKISVEALLCQNQRLHKEIELLRAELRRHSGGEMQIRSVQRSIIWITASHKALENEGSIATF